MDGERAARSGPVGLSLGAHAHVANATLSPNTRTRTRRASDTRAGAIATARLDFLIFLSDELRSAARLAWPVVAGGSLVALRLRLSTDLPLSRASYTERSRVVTKKTKAFGASHAERPQADFLEHFTTGTI